MKENYTKILITKLSQNVYDEFKTLAANRRRPLSSMSRVILEDYLRILRKGGNQVMKT